MPKFSLEIPFKEYEEIGIHWWQTPIFLMPISGLVTIGAMLITFWISSKYYTEEMAIMLVSSVASVMIVLTYLVNNGVEKLNKIRKELLKALEREQIEKERVDMIIYNLPSGILITDLKGKLVFMNPAAQYLLGIRPQAILEKNVFDPNLRKTFPILEKLFKEKEIPAGAKSYIEEKEFKKPRFRILQIITLPLKNHAPGVIGIMKILNDVTNERRVQKMKDEFYAMLIHDLRGPLSGIKFISQMLLNHSEKINKDQMVKSLNIIIEETSHLLDIVNDLLDVAKWESQVYQIKKQKGKITPVLEEAVSYFLPLAKGKNQQLTLFYEDDLPEIEFDRKELLQLMNNLLSNAVKFTSQGKKIKVDCITFRSIEELQAKVAKYNFKWFLKDFKRLEKIAPALLVTVTDEGPGIKPEDQNNLFKKFYQLEKGRQIPSKGTGLGLVISRKIVEAHKGQIGVASQYGQGSTFFFTLPLRN